MPLRLLIHAPTEAALERARSNARNLLAQLSDAKIEIVVNAKAVAPALIPAGDATDDLIVFCANSIRAQGLKEPMGHVVNAAVRHIAERQQQGWAYMRA